MDDHQKKVPEPGVTARLVEIIIKMSEDDRRNLLKQLEASPSVAKRQHARKDFFTVVIFAPPDRSRDFQFLCPATPQFHFPTNRQRGPQDLSVLEKILLECEGKWLNVIGLFVPQPVFAVGF